MLHPIRKDGEWELVPLRRPIAVSTLVPRVIRANQSMSIPDAAPELWAALKAVGLTKWISSVSESFPKGEVILARRDIQRLGRLGEIVPPELAQKLRELRELLP